MLNQLNRAISTGILLVFMNLSLAAVNPITLTFSGGATSFTANESGSANYVVAVNAAVFPANVPLTFALASLGSSLQLSASQITTGPSSACAAAVPVCTNPFSLSAGQACCLMLSLSSNQVGNYSLQPLITTVPRPTYRAQAPMALSVTVTQSSYTISGTISGLIGTVVLQNSNGDTLSTSTDGPFTFPTPETSGSSYAVTVKTQPATQTCTVSNGSGTVSNTNVTNITVTCATNAYTVGGTVTGLAGSGLVLQDNGGDNLPISSNGSFTFSTPVAEGSTYAVTVLTQPSHPNQICTVGNGSGTMGNANVTNVTVTCSTNTYTIGGSVSGLVGTGLVLQDNGGDNLPISSNGSFTFPTPLADGSTYDVTVFSQPSGPGQTCTVSQGSGTVNGANVTTVSVSCITNTTTLTVSAMGIIPVSASSGSITVMNTGTTYAATNVHAVLPGGWTQVVQDASDCTAIPPNDGSCTLTFTSTAAYVAQGNIQITGDNISNTATTALAFSISDYLVFSVDSPTSATVVYSSDTVNKWDSSISCGGGNCTLTNAESFTDGQYLDSLGNTYMIISGPDAIGQQPVTNGNAANNCYRMVSDNTGPVQAGTWYLPALCQMIAELSLCPSGIANIYSNLSYLGFGGFSNNSYWSSTEYITQDLAYLVTFFNDGAGGFPKGGDNEVRCVRSISY